ncbi:hypothetical protein DH86_00000430, partial [Scytalidium sp. 3C]
TVNGKKNQTVVGDGAVPSAQAPSRPTVILDRLILRNCCVDQIIWIISIIKQSSKTKCPYTKHLLIYCESPCRSVVYNQMRACFRQMRAECRMHAKPVESIIHLLSLSKPTVAEGRMPLLSQKLELLGLQDDTHHIHADPSNIGQGIQEDDDQDSDDEEDDIKTAWLSGGIDEDCNVGGCTMISSPVNYIELKFIAKKRCVIYLETLHPLVPNAIPVNYIKY